MFSVLFCCSALLVGPSPLGAVLNITAAGSKVYCRNHQKTKERHELGQSLHWSNLGHRDLLHLTWGWSREHSKIICHKKFHFTSTPQGKVTTNIDHSNVHCGQGFILKSFENWLFQSLVYYVQLIVRRWCSWVKTLSWIFLITQITWTSWQWDNKSEIFLRSANVGRNFLCKFLLSELPK